MGERAERVCERDYDLDKKEVYFKFSNGKVLTMPVGELNTETQVNLMLHGTVQKVGDSFAGAKGDVAKAVAAAQETWDQLKSGVWAAPREGFGGVRIGLLADAIARIKKAKVEDVRAALEIPEDASEEKKKAHSEKLKTLRAHPKIKAVIAAIQLEQAEAEASAADVPALVF